MKKKISVIGLGYVGLPLAIALAKKFNVIGYDKNEQRIRKLNQGVDDNGEAKKKDVKNKNLLFTSKQNLLNKQNVFLHQ